MTKAVFALALAAGVCATGVPARADLEVSAGIQIHATADFYTPLTPVGVWFDFGSHGRCWRPGRVAAEWRPYCEGYWEWTDCGWYWVSDEPWAWACYHYGTWIDDPTYGWVWVPGVEWAPAWVYWRTGEGHIGWAPCPPRGVNVSDGLFVFVAADRFRDPIRRSAVVVNDKSIISHTTLMAKAKYEDRKIDGGKSQRVVFNEGPGAAVVEKATGKKIESVRMPEVARRLPSPASRRPSEPAVKEMPRREAPIRPTEPPREREPEDRGRGPDRPKGEQ